MPAAGTVAAAAANGAGGEVDVDGALGDSIAGSDSRFSFEDSLGQPGAGAGAAARAGGAAPTPQQEQQRNAVGIDAIDVDAEVAAVLPTSANVPSGRVERAAAHDVIDLDDISSASGSPAADGEGRPAGDNNAGTTATVSSSGINTAPEGAGAGGDAKRSLAALHREKLNAAAKSCGPKRGGKAVAAGVAAGAAPSERSGVADADKPALRNLVDGAWDVDGAGGPARAGAAKRVADDGLLTWYDANKRALSWRGSTDPYRIWVSEVMSQQTRIATVEEYFARWMRIFPDVAALANADLERVKEVWSGLGYYRRAGYLHEGAKYVVNNCGGKFPVGSVDALRRIPGVGPYTAAAIASICGGVPAAAVDGNLIRVFLRYEGQRDIAPNTPAAFKKITAICGGYISATRPGDWNQAVMDLGSSVCTAAKASCGECPLSKHCQARALHDAGDIESIPGCIPLKQVKAAARVECWVVLVVMSATRVAMVRRAEGKGVLSGLWECMNHPSAELLRWYDAVQHGYAHGGLTADSDAGLAAGKKRTREELSSGSESGSDGSSAGRGKRVKKSVTDSAAKTTKKKTAASNASKKQVDTSPRELTPAEKVKHLPTHAYVRTAVTRSLLPRCQLKTAAARPVVLPKCVTHKFSHIHTHLVVARVSLGEETALDAVVEALGARGEEATAFSIEDVVSTSTKGADAAVSEQMRRVVRAAVAAKA